MTCRRHTVIAAVAAVAALSAGGAVAANHGTHGTTSTTVAVTTTVADTEATIPAATPVAKCGVERWTVKTGTDPDAGKVDLTPQPSTIAALDSFPSPITGSSKQPPRSSVEEQTFTITGTLTAYKAEGDSDLHLVISDGTRNMIAEIPNPGCVGPSSPFTAQIASAHAAFLKATGYRPGSTFVKSSRSVTVTGVGFFDFIHGQTGVAPNGIELHPVLSITFN